MKLIAHRGLFNGPDKNLENMPNQIIQAINLGFDCEIDLWVVKNDLYLGHDYGQFKVDKNFLSHPNLWIHAKNLDALNFLLTTSYNYFWHQTDDFTLTSHRYIWTYPGKDLGEKSILVMPELINMVVDIQRLNCFGICSDYVGNYLK